LLFGRTLVTKAGHERKCNANFIRDQKILGLASQTDEPERDRLTLYGIIIMYNVLKSLVLLALLSVLAACSTVTPVVPGEDFEVASVATVTVQPSDTEQGVAAKYGAKVITFKPEAGFAVLGFAKGQLTALNTTVNADFFAHPEVQASGKNAWGGGKNAWGGGLKAWSGGKNAWGGGTTGVPVLPGENATVWSQINLVEAHKDSRYFGAGVKVAVLDTGVDTAHEIFQGSLAPSSEWKDFVDNDTNPQEGGSALDAGFGHGTAVAGIILQVAPKATILPVRVLDRDGGGDLDDVIAGIDWAVQKGAKIINLSLGSVSNTDALTTMVNYAASRNVLVIASAGNQGQANALTFPARMSRRFGALDSSFGKIFSVGSVNSTGVTSLFSNYSGDLSGVAPGENIFTAFPGNQAIAATGTSFAAPLYSGAFALALSEHPNVNLVNLYMQFQNASASRTWNLGWWQRNFDARGFWDMGKGVINAEGLVEYARYGWGNLVGNASFSEYSTYWSGWTNAAVGFESGRNEVAVINGRGGFEQTLTGLHPNTTYRYQVEYKLSSSTDSLAIEYFVGGVWREVLVQGTTWAKPTITFTTGANETSAVIGVWKSSTTGTATVDNFFVAKQ
jgi:subtilisin family serine protease